jgi:hypothetical protein
MRKVKTQTSLFYLKFHEFNIYCLGEISMKKVKVNRYISGKRPEYAPKDASEESSNSDDDIFENRKSIVIKANLAEDRESR